MHALQRGLADDLGDQGLLRLVGQLALRVQRRALGQRGDQQVGEQLDLVAGDRGDRARRRATSSPASSPARWMAIRCSASRFGRDQVGLGGDGQHRLAPQPGDLARPGSGRPDRSARRPAGTGRRCRPRDQVARTRSLSRSPSVVRGLCRPGVSTSTSWASARCTSPRMACRVVCGFDDVMAILPPTMALVSVDLPVLGRPTKQAKPERKPVESRRRHEVTDRHDRPVVGRRRRPATSLPASSRTVLRSTIGAVAAS